MQWQSNAYDYNASTPRLHMQTKLHQPVNQACTRHAPQHLLGRNWRWGLHNNVIYPEGRAGVFAVVWMVQNRMQRAFIAWVYMTLYIFFALLV